MELNEKLIQVKPGYDDWREMIRKSGEEMVNEGYITTKYLEQIIQSVEKNGPYFVVADKIAIAHSDIDLDNIKKAGVSWNILEQDSLIGDKNPKIIKYLLILSTTNSNEHLEFLRNFSKVFMDSKLQKEFYNLNDLNGFKNFIKKHF